MFSFIGQTQIWSTCVIATSHCYDGTERTVQKMRMPSDTKMLSYEFSELN